MMFQLSKLSRFKPTRPFLPHFQQSTLLRPNLEIDRVSMTLSISSSLLLKPMLTKLLQLLLKPILIVRMLLIDSLRPTRHLQMPKISLIWPSFTRLAQKTMSKRLKKILLTPNPNSTMLPQPLHLRKRPFNLRKPPLMPKNLLRLKQTLTSRMLKKTTTEQTKM